MQHPDHPLTAAQRYGYVEEGGVWLRPVLGQPARRIGSVKGTEDDALRYFEQRYEAFEAKINELLERLQTADNQGSYLMKLLHLQEQTKRHDGLGDGVHGGDEGRHTPGGQGARGCEALRRRGDLDDGPQLGDAAAALEEFVGRPPDGLEEELRGPFAVPPVGQVLEVVETTARAGQEGRVRASRHLGPAQSWTLRGRTPAERGRTRLLGRGWGRRWNACPRSRWATWDTWSLR